MAQVKITPDENETYCVNNKTVFQDMNGNWVATQELTMIEAQFFNEYITTVKTLKRKPFEATYKV